MGRFATVSSIIPAPRWLASIGEAKRLSPFCPNTAFDLGLQELVTWSSVDREPTSIYQRQGAAS